MTGTIPCPGRCGGIIHFHAEGVLFGRESQVKIHADPFDLRRHAGCLSPNGGGESLSKAAA